MLSEFHRATIKPSDKHNDDLDSKLMHENAKSSTGTLRRGIGRYQFRSFLYGLLRKNYDQKRSYVTRNILFKQRVNIIISTNLCEGRYWNILSFSVNFWC